MWTLLAAIGVPLLKWIFSRISAKKLNDKEFVDYIIEHQKKRARAGTAAQEAETNLQDAIAEMDAEKKE